jgi:large subunit ribosomal protein L15
MALTLSNLKPPEGSTKKAKRVGRGPGSGKGKTSGKGHKGQKARSGYNYRIGMEGGQMPLHRRLPKRGFYNPARVKYEPVNLASLAQLEGVDRIDAKVMRQHCIIRRTGKPIKILARGELSRPVTIVADAASATAKKKIEAAGGAFEVAKSC